jgi:hypothetical protein
MGPPLRAVRAWSQQPPKHPAAPFRRVVRHDRVVDALLRVRVCVRVWVRGSASSDRRYAAVGGGRR